MEQIADIIESLDLNKVNLGHKIQKEFERYSHFQSKVLGITDVEMKKKKDVDIKNYAKYLLEEGTIVEKREMLECLKSKLILKDKKISLEQFSDLYLEDPELRRRVKTGYFIFNFFLIFFTTSSSFQSALTI